MGRPLTVRMASRSEQSDSRTCLGHVRNSRIVTTFMEASIYSRSEIDRCRPRALGVRCRFMGFDQFLAALVAKFRAAGEPAQAAAADRHSIDTLLRRRNFVKNRI